MTVEETPNLFDDQPTHDRASRSPRKYLQPPFSRDGKTPSVGEIFQNSEFKPHYEESGSSGRIWFGEQHKPVESVAEPPMEKQTALFETETATMQPEFYQVDVVLVPPGSGEIERGSGNGFEKKPTVPRTQYLCQLLNDLGIPLKVWEGKLPEGTVRKEPYRAIEIPAGEANKYDMLLLVCDEWGNATYVVYRPQDFGDLPAFARRKEDLENIWKPRGNVRIIEWPQSGDVNDWRNAIVDALFAEPYLTSAEEDQLGTITSADQLSSETLKNRESPRGEGWLSLRGLALRFGKDREYFTDARMNPIVARYPDEIRKTKNGKRTYYGPHIIQAIEELIAKEPLVAPPSWMTRNSIAASLGTDKETLVDDFKRWTAIYPDDEQRYLDPKGREFTYYSPRIIDAIRKEFENIPAPPADWMYLAQMEALLDRSKQFIKERLPDLVAQFPNETGSFRNPGNRRESQYFGPHIVAALVEEVAAQVEAPEGWKTVAEIAALCGRSHATVKKRLSELSDVRPEEAGEYQDSKHNPNLHYCPRVVEEILSSFAKEKPAPEDWLTVAAIASRFGTHSDAINRRIRRLLPLYPDQVGKYLDSSNYLLPHYSPELIKAVQNDLVTNPDLRKRITIEKPLAPSAVHSEDTLPASTESVDRTLSIQDLFPINEQERLEAVNAPDTWYPYTVVAELLKTNRYTVGALMAKHAEEIVALGWVRPYRDKAQRVSPHFSGECVEFLREKIRSFQFGEQEDQEEPEEAGWHSLAVLSESLGFRNTSDSVKKLLEEYKEEIQPQWVRTREGLTGKKKTRYSQELLDFLHEKQKERKPQEDWIPFYLVRQRVGYGSKTINRLLERFRSEFPQQCGQFPVKGFDDVWYYSPQVLEWIKQEYVIQPAGKDELTVEQLARELRTSGPRIKRRADKLSSNNPEWIQPRLDSQRREFPHLMPELVKLLRAEILAEDQSPQRAKDGAP